MRFGPWTVRLTPVFMNNVQWTFSTYSSWRTFVLYMLLKFTSFEDLECNRQSSLWVPFENPAALSKLSPPKKGLLKTFRTPKPFRDLRKMLAHLNTWQKIMNQKRQSRIGTSLELCRSLSKTLPPDQSQFFSARPNLRQFRFCQFPFSLSPYSLSVRLLRIRNRRSERRSAAGRPVSGYQANFRS